MQSYCVSVAAKKIKAAAALKIFSAANTAEENVFCALAGEKIKAGSALILKIRRFSAIQKFHFLICGFFVWVQRDKILGV